MREDMFEFVKNRLVLTGGENRGRGNFNFRKRSEHISRVYAWARRLIIENNFPNFDADAVLTAAIFHDAGYTKDNDEHRHAECSAEVFAEYAHENGMDKERARLIEGLVRDHSSKNLMEAEDTLLELITLMEADLMDESGAMSIVWDCMAEGLTGSATFESALKHVSSYSGRMMREGIMRTPAAKRIWSEKIALVKGFINSLERDIEFGIF